MGSKKHKNNPKLKSKKIIRKKIKKYKTKKPNKKEKSHLIRGFSFEGSLLQNKSFNRLTDLKGYSRSLMNNTYMSKVNNFSQIREYYFSYLQRVLKDNCASYGSQIAKDVLESLSLEIEQHALLMCLQADVYTTSMNEIIDDIRKYTKEKQIYKEIQKFLLKSTGKEIVFHKKIHSFDNRLSRPETYSRIPIINKSNTGASYNLESSKNDLSESGTYNCDTVISYCSSKEQTNKIYVSEEKVDLQSSWNCSDKYSESINISLQNDQSYESKNPNETLAFQACSDYQTIDVNKQDTIAKPESKVSLQTATKKNEIDYILEAQNRLKLSVEQNLINLKQINEKNKEEKERAYIAQILAGEDSMDDVCNDSLSDDETNTKENVEENLVEKLDKLRELFGVEEQKSPDKKFKLKLKSNTVQNRIKRPILWKHEKIIQLYKYSMLSTEMTFEKKTKNKTLFFELFGDDSDEEHEVEYQCEEKYRNSCIERISPWVVKYLMPYYHKKRIVGRHIFKSLGHYISNAIIDKVQYPDEWSVKYLVSKCFPPNKRYLCDTDILTSQIE